MMPRVASLTLPQLAIERLRPTLRTTASLPELRPRTLPVPDLPQAQPGECSAPRGGGWRPGARWARDDVAAKIEALPLHQRPPMREMGRRSEAMPAPYRTPSPTLREQERERPTIAGDAKERTASSPAGAQPLVLVTRAGAKLILAAACPLARALGLAPGMALAMARALVPGLGVRDADPAGDARLLQQFALHAARRWSPLAAVDAPDGLWLDMSAAPLFGGEARMAQRILRFLARRGFTGRIAIADSAGAAHALARHAAAPLLLCPPGRHQSALAPLPIEGLRIETDLALRLRRLGVETIGDLVAMPRGPLIRRFGRGLGDRLDQALGTKGEPIDGVAIAERPQAERRFFEPIATPEAIALVLGDLVTALTARLLALGKGARRIALVCRRVDNHDQTIMIGTARATRDPRHLLRLLTPKIESIEPGFGIEAMRLIAFATDALAAEHVPHDLAEPDAAPPLAELVDILSGRIGTRALTRPSAVESDVPERSVAAASPLSPATGWPARWPRPVRLIDPPERVLHVMAELPDRPPLRFTWRGHTHIVAHADGPERIHGEWWRRAGESDAVRDYFQVEDADGARFWLYRRGDGLDGRTGDLSWWLQGAFG